MRRIAPYQRDTDSWVQNAGWQPYMQVLRSAVMLAKESDLVKVEFRSREQSRMEPITYLNANIALADLAYGQQLVFKTVDEVISGVYNPLLKMNLPSPSY